MAYVNERWMEYDEREQYIKDLKGEQRLLVKLIKSGKYFESDLSRLELITDELDKCERVHRGERDVLYFALEYFGEELNPGNDGNLIPSATNYKNSAEFHKDLCEILNDVSEKRVKRHVAVAYPRGSAKTSYLSNIFLAHQLVYRKQKYIVLYSQTATVAATFIGWTRYQLKLNEKLINDFGRLLHEKPSMNILDNKDEFVTTTNSKVDARGLGAQTRGLRHSNTRPTLVLADDLESAESTNTKEQIAKSKSWFNEEMMPAMADGGLIVYMGTILCYDSLLDYVLRERKDFTSRKHAAVMSWAKREDLWKVWRDIYREDTEDSVDRAKEFYERNKEEMIEGTKVLWHERWTYYDLMEIMENVGTKSFNQEYQNNPTDEERQIFKPEFYHWFRDSDIQGMQLEYYCGVDFAMGGEKGDYSVIATIAKNVRTNTCYVVDLYMRRLHPDKFMDVIVQKALQYQYEVMGVESVMAQEFFTMKLTDALQENGYPGYARIKQIKHRTRKALRIESLLPDVMNGKLRFHEKYKNSQEMVQFEMYGTAAVNDDVPDAVHMAYSTASAGQVVFKMLDQRTR